MPKNTAPTEAEVAAAQEVLRRSAEARQREQDEATKPLRDLANSEAFTAAREAVEGLDNSWLADNRYGPHIMAIRTGMAGLAAAFAQQVPLAPEA